MEILSPIKSIENAKIAIKKGADALYLASPNFGARVNASIEKEELKDIIALARSNNVKTFVTFNVVIFDNEINDFLKEIDTIYVYGATGIIIQDFSFIKLIKKRYPDLEIHASTQMNIHNTNAVNFLKDLGVNQVVVPREMSFNKIHKLKKNTNIKIEAFAHGALCVSYSGQCYDSTLLDQKSANRGRCSQYCRMPSKVLNLRTNKYINAVDYSLNLKDLNTINILEDYKMAGVDVLKIEGRLKGIDYVGLVTESYKKKLEKEISNEKNLTEVYNRDFTTGLINSQKSIDLINSNRPNNNGTKIGEVKECLINDNKNLRFYKYKIIMNLEKEIYKGDNLRFLDKEEKGQLVEKFETRNNQVILYSKFIVAPKTEVYRTKNNKIIEEYRQEIKEVENKRRKIEVELKITQKKTVILLNKEKHLLNIEVFKAKNQELQKENIKEVLKKTKNTNYDIYLKDLFIEEGIFVTNKNLKKIRDEIINLFFKKEKTRKTNFEKLEKDKIVSKKLGGRSFYFTINQVSHLNYFLKKQTIKDVKIMISYSLIEKLKELKEIDLIKELKKKYEVFLVLPRVVYDEKEEELLEIIKYFENISISEIGSLKYKEFISGKIISNFSLNTTNTINQNFLKEKGIESQILSIELNKSKIKAFDKETSIINIYGAIPVMLMDYCPINDNKKNGCGDCRRCRSNNFVIKDKLNRSFPLRYEGDGKLGLYSEKKLSLFEELEELKDFKNFNVNIIDEEDKDIDLIFKSINKKKTYIKNTFKGNYNKEVL